ncbi:MAG: hypothetical protein ABL903_09885 [Methylococcales bacterium]
MASHNHTVFISNTQLVTQDGGQLNRIYWPEEPHWQVDAASAKKIKDKILDYSPEENNAWLFFTRL